MRMNKLIERTHGAQTALDETLGTFEWYRIGKHLQKQNTTKAGGQSGKNGAKKKKNRVKRVSKNRE